MSESVQETNASSEVSEASDGSSVEDPNRNSEQSEPTNSPTLSENPPVPPTELSEMSRSGEETIVVNVPPKRGGIDQDGETVWTGGNPAEPNREMESLNCLRPSKNKDLASIRKDAIQGLEPQRRLGMPGAAGSSISIATWLRYVIRHLRNCGMDSVFYIPKRGAAENGPLYFLCSDWGSVTIEDVEAFLSNDDNFDRYDKQNLNWSGEFLQDSITLELWTEIEPDVGIRLSGPRILAAVIRQYRSTASVTIRNLTNKLMEMSLVKTPGENVDVLCNAIFEIASQIEGLGEAPGDLASLVAARFLNSTSQAFCSKAMSVFERTQDFDNPMRWPEVLRQLKGVYGTLKGQNMWPAIDPPAGADSAMAAMQRDIAELKRRGKTDKDDGVKSEGETTKKNLIKSHPAPKDGEPLTKIIDGKECSYCARCRRWTFGSKKHTTEEHRTAAEIKAAKASGKDGESANLAADKQFQYLSDDDRLSHEHRRSLQDARGFLASRVFAVIILTHTLIGLSFNHDNSYLTLMNRFHALLALVYVVRGILSFEIVHQALREIKWVLVTDAILKTKPNAAKEQLCFVPEFFLVFTGVVIITNYQLGMRLRRMGHRTTIPKKHPLLLTVRKPPDPTSSDEEPPKPRRSKREKRTMPTRRAATKRQSKQEKTNPAPSYARSLGLLLLCAGAQAERMVPNIVLSSERTKPFRNRMSRYCDDKAFLQTARISKDEDLISLRSHLQESQAAYVSADDHSIWIIDTGASKTTSPFKDDFLPGSIKPLLGPKREIHGIAGNLAIEGEGIIRQEVVLNNGEIQVIETPAWYIPDLPVRLLSPQQYLNEGVNVPDGTEYQVLKGKESVFEFGSNRELTVSYHRLSRLPTFRAYNDAMRAAHALSATECVTAETNQNLPLTEKLLLQYHYILGHLRFLDVVWLGRMGYLGAKGETMATGHFTAAPKCAACLFGKQSKTPNPGKSTTNKNPGALKKDKLQPGELIFSDQYQSRVEGLTVGIQADGSVTRDIRGGTLFVDAASGYIWIHHQAGLNATETINAKLGFERTAAEAGINVQSYHTDNGIYSSKQFLKELYDKKQDIHFSGVSAQFQNGVAENAIKNTVLRARTQMMQSAIRWPETFDERLWPLSLSHAVHLHNTIPKEAYGGLSPEEIFTGVKSAHAGLPKLHPWGCPAYVLDPKLQEGHKIPKWAPRSRRAQYVGTSPLHASSVGLVRNLRTGHISPQFHVVYDNFFQTVYADGEEPPAEWEELIQTSREFPEGFTEDDLPELDHEWSPDLTRQPEQDSIEAAGKQREPSPIRSGSPGKQREPVDQDSGLRPTASEPTPATIPGPAPQAQPPPTRDENPLAVTNPNRPLPPPAPDPSPRTSSRPQRERKPPKKFEYDKLGDPNLFAQSELFQEILCGLMESSSANEFSYRHAIALLTCNGTLEGFPPTLNWKCPHALKTTKHDPDMPTLKEVLGRPDRERFEEAMDVEIQGLHRQRTWSEISRDKVPKEANIIPLTWTFKIKRFPDGTIRKYKARICVRGDLQRAGIDYFETYAPVVAWSTVRMMLVNTAREKLHTRMIDFTNAFTQAHLDKDVYVHLPPRYDASEPGTVLKLNRALYGLSESPKEWFTTLKNGLEGLGFRPSEGDPCLFFGHGVVLLVYVDDCILFGRDSSQLDEIIEKMRLKFEMTQEEIASDENIDIYAYLGVSVQHDKATGAVTLLQTGLIDKVLKTCGMDECNKRDTPADTHPLGTDTNGPRCKESWNYASVVGMLMYICSNSRPDIQYAVHQCARFTHNPRASHEQAIVRILRYLQGTKGQGLVFKPCRHSSLDCYVDADFAGLWNVENHDDSVCVKSRTGFVITLGGCPVIWSSKLQTEIALSTTEAEYIALSQAMRSLLPLRALYHEISAVLKLEYDSTSKIKSNVYEDNNGCIKIASDPLKFSARTKHIAVKYHFFRSHVGKDIQLHKIDTNDQIADIFTKGLPRDQFRHLARILMGWIDPPADHPMGAGKIASNHVRFDTSLERECDDKDRLRSCLKPVQQNIKIDRHSSVSFREETRMNTILNAKPVDVVPGYNHVSGESREIESTTDSNWITVDYSRKRTPAKEKTSTRPPKPSHAR